MAKIGTGIMVLLFWTGLASGPAGAANDPAFIPAVPPSQAGLEAEAVDVWLADVAACDAGLTARCAPVLY